LYGCSTLLRPGRPESLEELTGSHPKLRTRTARREYRQFLRVQTTRESKERDMTFYIAVPLLVTLVVLPGDSLGGEQRLARFSRLRAAVNQEVYVTDSSGAERRLTLLEAGEQALILSAGVKTITIDRHEIAGVDRARDGVLDGPLKGAAFGLVLSLIATGSTHLSFSEAAPRAITAYAAIGLALDWGHTHRQKLYRAPAAGVSVTRSIRF
jgi:hypothetical protein